MDIAAVLKVLRGQGVEEAYIRLLEDIYKESTGIIILHKESKRFAFNKGVRHRNKISPKLFTASIESVIGRI